MPISVANEQFGPGSRVSVGHKHACVLQMTEGVGDTGAPDTGLSDPAAGGRILCWGERFGHTLPPRGTFVDLSVGGYHACALDIDGEVACWGQDTEGRGLFDPPPGPFVEVTSGHLHSCARALDGSVTCWGGDLAYGGSNAPPGPYLAVEAGYSHTCAILMGGQTQCWGYNIGGQTDAPSDTVMIAVDAGTQHSCALTESNEIICWGDEVLPDGSSYGQATPPRGQFDLLSVASSTNCALDAAGLATCWGNNDEGQADPPPEVWTDISAGYYASCGLTVGGSVECWGFDWVSDIP